MEKKKATASKLSSSPIPLLLFYALTGATCGFLGATRLLPSEGGASPAEFFAFFAVMLLSIFLSSYGQILLHEGGHCLFGRLTGYQFISFRIGSHIFLRQQGKIARKKFSIANTGGQCLMAPPDGTNFPYVLYQLGGPIANAAMGAASLALSYVLQGNRYFSYFFLVFAIIGFASALINGLPMRLAGIANDGYNTLLLHRDPLAREALRRQLLVNQKTAEGIRIKDMPAAWFRLPDGADKSNPLICAIGILAFACALDKLDFVQARTVGKDLLENAPGLLDIQRNELLCEMLFLELIGECRQAEIDMLYTKKLQDYIKITQAYPSRKRLLYAYARIADDDAAAAQLQREAFERCVLEYPYPAEIENERELLALADAAAQKRHAASHA